MMAASEQAQAAAAASERPCRQAIIDRLLETGAAKADLLPALETLAGRMVECWGGVLTRETQREITASVAKVSADTAQFFLAKTSPDGVSMLVRVEDWAHPVVVGATRPLVFALLEAAFGGDGSEAPFTAERPFTPIELELASWALRHLAAGVEQSFAGIAPVGFRPEPVAGELDAEAEGLEDCGMIGVMVNVEIGEAIYQALIGLPQDALEIIAADILRAGEEPVRHDPEWSGQLAREVHRAPVEIEASLDGGEMALKRLTQLKAGDLLRLPANEGNLVDVRCNGTALMKCRLGQADGMFHVKIDHFVADQADMMDAVLAVPGSGHAN